jgi:ROS/MUCR transcriptional regulator protein
MPPRARSEHARGVPARSPGVRQRAADGEGPAVALGRLPDGTPYFAPLGEIAYDPDEDRVQCHLCGRWYRVIAGSHLHRVHGWTLEEYREAFRLIKGMPTVAAGVSAALAAHTRRRAQDGELPADFPPEWRARQDGAARYRVQRWRSLAVLRPDLAAQRTPAAMATSTPTPSPSTRGASSGGATPAAAGSGEPRYRGAPARRAAASDAAGAAVWGAVKATSSN